MKIEQIQQQSGRIQQGKKQRRRYRNKFLINIYKEKGKFIWDSQLCIETFSVWRMR